MAERKRNPEHRWLRLCRTTVSMAVFLSAAPAARALPADAQNFVDRRAQCIYWADEDPYDSARAAAITQAMDELGCAELEAEEDRLRVHYRARQAIIDALDGRSEE
ncbi:hypothetical protein [Mesorhizobium sp. CAU 1732]|uniref:hypothetical protein n=1 Tax=Mesorhizobium sp. CAU 1732 TaxID=3140358 RepID=UPI003260585C